MIDTALEWLRDVTGSATGTLLVAVAWVVGGLWIAALARDRTTTLLTRRSMSWNSTVLVSRVVAIAICVVAILIALNVLGVSGTGLIAVVSAFTVAIGLSLQDVMKMLERPFEAGDRIVVRDVTGEVQGIDIRTTLVRNINDELVLIPNATVFTEILRNDSYYGVRRVDLSITSPERRIEQIESALHGARDEIAGLRRPYPEPRIVSRTADGLTVRMSVIVDNSDLAQNRIDESIIDALPGDTIEVTNT